MNNSIRAIKEHEEYHRYKLKQIHRFYYAKSDDTLVNQLQEYVFSLSDKEKEILKKLLKEEKDNE